MSQLTSRPAHLRRAALAALLTGGLLAAGACTDEDGDGAVTDEEIGEIDADLDEVTDELERGADEVADELENLGGEIEEELDQGADEAG